MPEGHGAVTLVSRAVHLAIPDTHIDTLQNRDVTLASRVLTTSYLTGTFVTAVAALVGSAAWRRVNTA